MLGTTKFLKQCVYPVLVVRDLKKFQCSEYMVYITSTVEDIPSKQYFYLFINICFLTKDYPLELFTWGSNTNFTLGHRDESTRYAPELLESVPGDPKVCIREVAKKSVK